MSTQATVEILLGMAALALLARDLYRAWRDKQRRPVTLLAATLMVALITGASVSGEHPSPWWLLLPGALLAWEVARGWRRTPRCHRWEAGVGAFALGLVLAAGGLLVAAGAAGAAGLVLFYLSRRREPRPWRANDVQHYERRGGPRPDAS
jgi:hypothetical protein